MPPTPKATPRIVAAFRGLTLHDAERNLYFQLIGVDGSVRQNGTADIRTAATADGPFSTIEAADIETLATRWKAGSITIARRGGQVQQN